MKRLLCVFPVLLFLSCAYETYNISVENKSPFIVVFQMKTGHRTEEYSLDPGKEWNYSLLKAFDHKMVSVKIYNSSIKAGYRYSDNIYTILDTYTITFNANGAFENGKQVANFTQELLSDFKGPLPSNVNYVNLPFRADGWNLNNLGTGVQFENIEYSISDITSKLTGGTLETWKKIELLLCLLNGLVNAKPRSPGLALLKSALHVYL